MKRDSIAHYLGLPFAAVIGPGKIGDRFRRLPQVGRLQAIPKQASFSEGLGWVGVWAGPDHSAGSEAESSNVGTPGPGSAGTEGTGWAQ